MSEYRKKPIVIEAVLNRGSNLKEIETFLAGKVLPDSYAPRGDFGINWGNGEVFIHTLEGTMLANVGDWIIKGVKGEFYPCKPDVFEATYEPATTDKLAKHVAAVERLREAAEEGLAILEALTPVVFDTTAIGEVVAVKNRLAAALAAME